MNTTLQMNLRETIQKASTRILRRDAETLALHLLGQNRAWLFAHPDEELPFTLHEALEHLIERRTRHEPLQYLTGQQEFYGLDLHVTPDVLIPRPETELLVEKVLAWAGSQPTLPASTPLRLIDVGTGSGAIALALATYLPSAMIAALDRSPAALEIAQGNAKRLDLLSPRLQFLVSDLLAALSGRANGEVGNFPVDVVISNPPYVPQADAPTLQPEVRDYEPHLALFAGEDGLEIYRRLIPQAKEVLRSGGLLALEFGFGQKAALGDLLTTWHNVHFFEDLAGIPRIVLAERP